MWKFNLVVTLGADGRYRRLLEELAQYGDFRRTGFHGVILGYVDHLTEFLELLRSKREQENPELQDLGRVVPLESCFVFHPDAFQEKIKETLAPYAADLNGRRFYVRLERRGLKGTIVSPEAERNFDNFLLEEVEKSGGSAEISFENPDIILVVETLGDRCAIGRLTRDMRERYPFVRVS